MSLETILPIQEIISHTIQGEGFCTGQLSSFIRLFGCPVACPFCDTGYATPESLKGIRFIKMSIQEILDSVPCRHVVITGGEPTIHRDSLSELLHHLKEDNKFVSIETSGLFPLPDWFIWVTLSPKEHLNLVSRVHKDYWENASELKIVVTKQQDIDYYLDKIKLFLDRGKPVFLQPEWSKKEQSLEIIMQFIRTYSEVKLSVQSHKFLGLR